MRNAQNHKDSSLQTATQIESLSAALVAKGDEVDKMRGDLSKTTSELERAKKVASNHAESMKSILDTEVQKVKSAAQEEYVKLRTQMQSEHTLALSKLRATNADQLTQAGISEGDKAEITRLQTLLQKRTERMSEIDCEKKEELEKMKVEQQKVLGEAGRSAEQRWTNRHKESERREAKLREELHAKDVEVAKRIQKLHQEKDALKVIIETSETSSARTEEAERLVLDLNKELEDVKKVLEASEQSAASALEDCEQRFQHQFEEVRQQHAELEKTTVKLRAKLKDERSQLSLSLAMARTALLFQLDEARSKCQQLEEQLEAERIKASTLQEQVEEAEAAQTMCPGAEGEQQRNELVEKLHQRDEELRQMSEKLIKSSQDVMERQTKQTELEMRIKLFEKVKLHKVYRSSWLTI